MPLMQISREEYVWLSVLRKQLVQLAEETGRSYEEVTKTAIELCDKLLREEKSHAD